MFGKGGNFSNHNNLLHTANKLFFEVTELISDKENSDLALCIIITIEFFYLLNCYLLRKVAFHKYCLSAQFLCLLAAIMSYSIALYHG